MPSIGFVTVAPYESGDGVRLRFAVVDEDGNPTSILGHTIRFALAARDDLSDIVASTEAAPATATATATDAVNGLFEVTISSSVTLPLSGVYRWDAELLLAGERETVANGSLRFVPGVLPAP